MTNIEALTAERDITREVVRFARAMDERDWSTVRAIMYDDATADVGEGLVSSGEAVIASIRKYLDACGPTQHLIGNVLVELEPGGGRATSKAYVHDLHLGTGANADLTFQTLGDYHDQWEHDGDHWRMRHRKKYNHASIGSLAVFGAAPATDNRPLRGEVTDSYVEILNLIYRYPELIDGGDFAGVGELFRDATIVLEGPDGAPVAELIGAAAVQANFEQNVRLVSDDGTPHTRHVVSNPIVEIDEATGSATCRYYITVFQRTDELPLQPVWANRYEDRLRRVDETWRIEHRRGYAHLPGDTSHHLFESP